MKTLRFLRREFLQIVLLILPFVLAAAWWNKIPTVVVTHWDIHGHPNGWMPKAPGLLLTPTLNVGMCLLLAFLPTIDPRLRGNPAGASARYRRILRIYRYAFTTFIMEIALAIIAMAAGWRVDINLIAVNGMLALFGVVGNYLGNLPPNYFVGCRTPWTLQNGDTWRATHRVVGRLMCFGAVGLLAAEFFVSREVEIYLLIGYGGALALWSLGYSVWFFQRRRLAA